MKSVKSTVRLGEILRPFSIIERICRLKTLKTIKNLTTMNIKRTLNTTAKYFLSTYESFNKIYLFVKHINSQTKIEITLK